MIKHLHISEVSLFCADGLTILVFEIMEIVLKAFYRQNTATHYWTEAASFNLPRYRQAGSN